MSNIVHWTYLPLWKPKNLSNQQIISAIHEAMNEWNSCLKDLIELKEGSGELQIRIFFEEKMDKKFRPNKIAECRTFNRPRRWEICFDGERKWNVGGWRKALGIGFDFRSTILHEIGHVFNLPHSSNESFIMYADYNEIIKLSSGEKQHYRDYFIKNN